jgi:hypothetical protein
MRLSDTFAPWAGESGAMSVALTLVTRENVEPVLAALPDLLHR